MSRTGRHAGARFRPFRAGDEPGAYHVCLKTGDHGKDGEPFYREDPDALGRIYVGPYLALEPELALILEDESGVCGYCLGALDSRGFYRRYEEEWRPNLTAKFPEPAGDSRGWSRVQWVHYLYHHPDYYCPEPYEAFPSHVHIDLLERARGQGHGRRMTGDLMGQLRELGSPGVHLGMSASNTLAWHFYRKLGFVELVRTGEGDQASCYMGQSLRGWGRAGFHSKRMSTPAHKASNACVIGIDGGGTRSRGLCLSLDGRVLARAEGGLLNYHASSLELFRRHLTELIALLLRPVPAGSHVVRYTIGTAALFDFATAEETRLVCEGIVPLGEARLLGDGLAAVYGAHNGQPGVLVASGTGSIAVAMDAAGTFHTQGGFGPLIGGDPGSAFWMGSQAILTAARMEGLEGRATAFSDLVRRHFQVDDLHGLIPQIYGAKDGSKRVAGLAGFLAESSLSLEHPFAGIQREAGLALAAMAEPLVRRAGTQTLCLAGSVLDRNRLVRQSLVEELGRRMGSGVDVRPPAMDAAAGAALLALREAGAAPAPSLLEQLKHKPA